MNVKRAIFLPTAILGSATIGGVAWALYTHLTGRYAGLIAVLIGMLSGSVLLMVGGSRRSWAVRLGALISALLALLIGKYLDVRWNFVSDVVRQLMQAQPDLPRDAAEQIARLQREGVSTWELLQQRLIWYDAISLIVAAFLAFRIASSAAAARFFGEA